MQILRGFRYSGFSTTAGQNVKAAPPPPNFRKAAIDPNCSGIREAEITRPKSNLGINKGAVPLMV